MKTKEEFLQEAYGYKFEEEDFINPAIAITLIAMEKYAQEVVNNLHKADVSNSFCDLNPDFQQYLIEQGETKCKQCGKKLKAK